MVPIEMIKKIAIDIGQFHNFRRVYRFFKRQNIKETEILLSQLNALNLKGKLVFDIGANVGLVSEALLRTGARVVAIEPNISLLPELQARCANKDHLTVLPIAISSNVKIEKFYIPQYAGQASFSESWSDSLEPMKKTYVPALTFQELFNVFGIPYYVKIDVEGHELDVFRGMKTQVPLVSFEFHMDPKRVEEALKIMKQYRSLGDFAVNIIFEGDRSQYFKEAISYTAFEEKFESLCAQKNKRRKAYGQCFMQALPASPL